METQRHSRPFLWFIDAEKEVFGACAEAFADWADCKHFAGDGGAVGADVGAGSAAAASAPDWNEPPDAIFFSAEIVGGANGEVFAGLLERAGGEGGIPLLAVARLRSLAQAVAYFRAGAADYLSLPLGEEDARARFGACIGRAAKFASRRVPQGGIAVGMLGSAGAKEEEEDILAQVLPSQTPVQTPEPSQMPEQASAQISAEPQAAVTAAPVAGESAVGESVADEEGSGAPDAVPGSPDDEPVPVDGLPIPSLWEELPCGLLVFDSLGNLVFANRPGLDLLGRGTLAELQDALENNLSVFAAHGLNGKPLPDNQWPHLLAVRTRTPRSAVVSIQMPVPDKRRSWLRIDCQPHISDGKITRLSMTVVNLTGELPPLRVQEGGASPEPPPPSPSRKKQRGRKK